MKAGANASGDLDHLLYAEKASPITGMIWMSMPQRGAETSSGRTGDPWINKTWRPSEIELVKSLLIESGSSDPEKKLPWQLDS